MSTVIKTILWTFGDGAFSTVVSPEHTYRMPGKYVAKVEIYDIYDNYYSSEKTIYVYDWDYLSDEGLRVSVTTESLRLALKPSQGNGWAVFRGEDWLWPEARNGTLKIIDNKEKHQQIVWDARSGLPYLVGDLNQWTDKADGSYDGTEIEGEIRFPEDRGSAEHYTLESLEHHVHLRPHDEDSRGADGHTATGYRNGFSVDLAMFEDGEQITEAARTENIPIDGDIVFDRKLEAHRMQLKFTTTTSFWKLVRRRSYYVAKDKAAPPSGRAMSQYDHQAALEDAVMWLSRGDSLLLDKITNVEATGSYLAVATGPDGYSGSAMQFNGAEGIYVPLASPLSGDFTAMIWASAAPDCDMISFSTGPGHLSVFNVVGDSPRLQWDDGPANHEAEFEWDKTWKHFGIRRKGELYTLYVDGAQVGTSPVGVYSSYGGTIAFGVDVGTLFEPRIFASALDNDTIKYYYDDVIQNKGNSVMDIF